LVSRVSLMVLGLLMEGEKHGYELVREMEERGMLRWTHASKVAVYKSLDRMEDEGFLTSWTEREGNAPEKRVFSLTAPGEERLRDLVYALCASQEPLRFDTCVGLYFSSYLKKDEMMDALERRMRYVEAETDRLRREEDMLKGITDDILTEITRHELKAYVEERRFLKSIMERLNAGRVGDSDTR
jgi:DNA-binding PadR family transcriptional regulator